LFIHGGTASTREWRWVLPALGGHARCVAVDRLGCGLSDRAVSYEREALTNSLVAVPDALGWDRFGVVGQSFGGLWALSVAFGAPNRVSRLILVDSAVGPRTEEEIAERRARPPAFQLGKAWGEMTEDERSDEIDSTLARIFVDASRVDPSYRDDLVWQREHADPNHPRLSGDLYEGIARQRYDEIRCPTLVVWGEGDVMDPVRFGRRLAAAIPRAKFVGLPGVGHTCQIEAPADFAAAVGEFLDETDTEKTEEG
jgi:pimeloyl-ACP methyl ester carboxylesterase